MSWPEIKKAVNSDISTPLNHLIWLNDYKIFGDSSFVFLNKDALHELYTNYKLCMNDSAINAEAFEYVLSVNTEVGTALANVYGIEATDTLKSLSTMNAVASSTVAMNAVANSTVAMNAVGASSMAIGKLVVGLAGFNPADYADMNAVANSTVAMNAVVNSEVAMNAVAKGAANWTTSVKKNFFTTLNNSSALVKRVYAILTNTKYFTKKISIALDAVSSLNSYGTASYAANGFIACFLGSYSSGSGATTNLFIDGEQVASNSSVSRPSDVSASNVNAIACPTATFTESGDGQAAIEVYTAV